MLTKRIDLTFEKFYAPEFFNVWVVASIGLFGLNNFIFKYHYSGWITGKLSDFLFCFFSPLYLSAIFGLFGISFKRRLIIGSYIIFLLFSSVKLFALASSLLNQALSTVSTVIFGVPSINLVDPSDLIALPMILVSVYFAKKRYYE